MRRGGHVVEFHHGAAGLVRQVRRGGHVVVGPASAPIPTREVRALLDVTRGAPVSSR